MRGTTSFDVLSAKVRAGVSAVGDLPGDLPGAAAPVPEEDLQNKLRPVGPGGPVSGLMEFAGVDKAARSKTGVWKMQEWTIWHHVAEMDFAGVDNAAPCGRGGQCRSGVQ